MCVEVSSDEGQARMKTTQVPGGGHRLHPSVLSSKAGSAPSEVVSADQLKPNKEGGKRKRPFFPPGKEKPAGAADGSQPGLFDSLSAVLATVAQQDQSNQFRLSELLRINLL